MKLEKHSNTRVVVELILLFLSVCLFAASIWNQSTWLTISAVWALLLSDTISKKK